MIGPVLQLEGRDTRWYVRANHHIYEGYYFFWKNRELIVEDISRLPKGNLVEIEITVAGKDVVRIMQLDSDYPKRPRIRCYPAREEARVALIKHRTWCRSKKDKSFTDYARECQALQVNGWVRTACPDLYRALGLSMLAKHIWELRRLLKYLSKDLENVALKDSHNLLYYKQAWLDQVRNEVHRYFELQRAVRFIGSTPRSNHGGRP